MSNSMRVSKMSGFFVSTTWSCGYLQNVATEFQSSKVRPLFFISLFLVTSARSFRRKLKIKIKKSTTGVEQRSSIWAEHDRARQRQHRQQARLTARLLQVWQCQSPPCCGRGFIEVPVCTSCVPRMLCEGGACSHSYSRAEADAHLTATLGDWLGLDTEMCMIPAMHKKTKVCTSACLWPDAVWGYWDFFWAEIFFFRLGA